MTSAPASLAGIAATIGNPARSSILIALLDGRALTAKELAFVAGVSPQTTSEHLAQLTGSELLSVTRQGRHAYYRIASPAVARMLEGMMAVASDGPPRWQPVWRGGDALRHARTCYDHLAGRLGVRLCDALMEQGCLALNEDGGELTPAGTVFLNRFGIALDVSRGQRRPFCRPCLDWSERRPHLAGTVGRAICSRCFELGWITRMRDTRAVRITPDGHTGFAGTFGIDLSAGTVQVAA